MSKHTPGKWYIEEDDDGKLYAARVYAESDTYRGTIAHCQDARHIDGIGLDECKANARLIAASPMLLEALKIMVEQEVNYMLINNLGDPEQQHGVIISRAAIAAAEGKEGA